MTLLQARNVGYVDEDHCSIYADLLNFKSKCQSGRKREQ